MRWGAEQSQDTNLSTAHTVEFPTGLLAWLCLPGNASYFSIHDNVVSVLKGEGDQGYLVPERKTSSTTCAASPWEGQEMAHFTHSEGEPCNTHRCPLVQFAGHELLYTLSLEMKDCSCRQMPLAGQI